MDTKLTVKYKMRVLTQNGYFNANFSSTSLHCISCMWSIKVYNRKLRSALFGENEIIKFHLMKFRQTIISFSLNQPIRLCVRFSLAACVHFKGISLNLVPINWTTSKNSISNCIFNRHYRKKEINRTCVIMNCFRCVSFFCTVVLNSTAVLHNFSWT